jgi:hypothetical protein
MSTDPFVNATPNLPTSEGEQRDQRQERLDMVERARVIGEAQQRTRNAPPVVQPKRDLASMVPPEHRANPQAYLNKMIERGGGHQNSRSMDSSKIGAPPVDASILDNCLSPGGFTCSPADLKPGSKVVYKGYEMEVEQAVREGLLVRNAQTGGYALPDKSAQDAREAVAKQAAEWDNQQAAGEIEAKRAIGEEADAELQSALDLVSKHVPAQAADALVQDFISNGSMSEANVVKLAESLGWTGDKGLAVASEVHNGMLRQATTAVASVGVPVGEAQNLWNWMASNYPQEHQNAIRSMAIANDVKGLKALAKKYIGQTRNR